MISHRLVHASLALALAGCGGTDSATVLAASIASPNPAHRTEPVTITISMHNVSGRTIQVAPPQTAGCTHYFAIVDESGRTAEFASQICTLIGYLPMDLRPGETVEYVEDWTPSSATIAGAPLAAGSYQVRPANLGNVHIGSSAMVTLQLID
jgi:hypothetical protein